MEIHESFRLHITDDKYYIEPTDAVINELLVIDRLGQDFRLQKRDTLPHRTQALVIYGILGTIRLLAGPYLVVITSRKKVGEIHGHAIWQITGTQTYPFAKNLNHITEEQKIDNGRYVNMLTHMLSPFFNYYYSTSYDITHTLQRIYEAAPEFKQIAILERADTRFVWNNYLLQDLRQTSELAQYCLPVICGFVEISPGVINGKPFTYTIISRRSFFRAGVRYYMRGIDSEGHVANYVETEQIVEHENLCCSYIQTRGSIPLYWSQFPNLKYKPLPVIEADSQRDLSQIAAFQRHFASQIVNYGRQTIINLLDQTGPEKELFDSFGSTVQMASNPSIRYHPFDFHHECRRMRWDRLSLLMDQISTELSDFNYFLADRSGKVLRRQEGVFRTNCIDCLDRTNVVQSLIARKILQEQFTVLQILSSGQRIEDEDGFETTFKNVWADNADSLAKQYAGTGALKTDFTRTGKRTRMGLLKDGWNSAYRYYLNNFYDGFRQDAIDIFLGNYIVEDSEGLTKPSPWKQKFSWISMLPLVLIVAVAMLFISLLLPDENLGEQIMYVFFWISACSVTVSFIYYYGNDLVNRPHLANDAKVKLE